HQGAAGDEDYLLVSATGRFASFRRAVPRGAPRARARSARQSRRADPRRGCRNRRIFHADRIWDVARTREETRVIDGRGYVLEYPIHADYALIGAERGDRWGNLVYRKTARNFGPIMATAARCTIAEVREIVPLGALDPECVVTPGIFVHRLVPLADPRRAAS